jgi:hypothetical protein
LIGWQWDVQAVFRFAIKDEEPRRGVEREGLSQLLHDPHARRVLGDVEMQDLPSVMTDNEEAVEHAECNRWNREEIHRGNRFAMIVQKREPSLGWFRISWRPADPAGDGSLRDIETQHEQLAVDARRSPGRVLGHHAKN